MKAVALTDHGNLFGAADFFLSAPKFKIKPVIGCEMYVTPFDLTKKKIDEGEARYYHLVLLAKDTEGYKNLVEMVSIASLEGFYYRPRIDFKILEQKSKGLVALSACLGGEIPRLIMDKDLKKAEERARYHEDLFGKNNYFLEIMDNGLESQTFVNQKILEISKKTGIPLVATNDVHYPNQEDSKAHDVFLCIGSGKKLTEEKRRRYESDQFYFKTYEEMKKSFENISLESLSNTVEIADMCNYYPELGKFNLPHYELPEGLTDTVYLKQLCEKTMPTKYPDDGGEVKKRLDYELGVIDKMGFSSYFLIVQDFIIWAKNNGVMVGPGRGSAAGSIVAYLLGITELEPLKYDLLFERFLNPGRISMPDIDTDFDDFGREKVIEYVRNKYGKDYVAQIVTFGRLKSKAVIKDVGRVLDIPLDEVNAITKLIPSNVDLKKAMAEVPELKTKIESSDLYQELWGYSLRLEGLNRNTSIHAAGIVIGKEKLISSIPLWKDNKTGAIVTQFEGKHLEEFGLMKMDFLGLRNLRIIGQALALIETHHNLKIDLLSIPITDPMTYEIFQKGQGVGVFQCESPGMQELMKNIYPEKFEDIIALLALFRPGPLNSGMVENFVKTKKDPRLLKYPHPDLEKVLKDTYGVIVYQEQVMLISQVIGGFNLPEADNLRKVMGKKDASKLPKMGEKFVNGAVSRNYGKEFAETLFDQMAKFAEYGFNKSHSAAYALVAYQTAYLKVHYPIEYMTSVLNAEKGGKIEDLAIFLKEAKNMGIEILPPHINKSELDFSIENGNAIRFGLSAIKNIGAANVTEIIKERHSNGEFKSLSDLLIRADVNKKVLENLTLSGGLDGLIPNRATLIQGMEKVLNFIALQKKDRNSGMGGLFDSAPEESKGFNELQLAKVPEFKENDLLKMEKQNVGFYVTGHPLAKFSEKISAYSTKTTSELREIKRLIDSEEDEGLNIPEEVSLAGMFINIEIKRTKKNDEMAIALLEDLESEIRVVIFPNTYKNFMDKINLEDPVVISGNYVYEGKEAQINVRDIKLLKILPDKVKTVILNIKLDEKRMRPDHLNYLYQVLHAHKGKSPVVFHLYDLNKNRKVNIKAGDDFLTTPNDSLMENLRKIACIEDIWLNENH